MTRLLRMAGGLFILLVSSPVLQGGDLPQASGPPKQGIVATQRAAFDAYVGRTLAQRKTGVATSDRSERQAAPTNDIQNVHWRGTGAPDEASFETLSIDWESFGVRGEENLKFPQMLFDNEFRRLPLYYANPVNLSRRLVGRPTRDRASAPEVANSSFFTNTDIPSYTPEYIAAEVESFLPKPPLEITKVKDGGTSEGIWAKDSTGRLFIFVFDPPFAPEMTTSAEFIGSTLTRITGYHVPFTFIWTIEGTGNNLYDGRRAVGTIALDNFKGGWRYASFAGRREVRALQLVGAWINNVDQTEQNTGLTIDDQGVIRHYVLDFGASLGSFTFRPQMARLGWTRLFDAWQQFSQPLYDAGIRRVPWEAPYRVHSPAVGYFTANFDPDRWQPFYTNMGFLEVTDADRRWAAKRIAQFSDEQIRAVVDLARYSHRSDADHVTSTLIRRRDIITDRYLPGLRSRAGTSDAPGPKSVTSKPTPMPGR